MSTRVKIRYPSISSKISLRPRTISMSYSEYDLFHLIGILMYIKSKIAY